MTDIVGFLIWLLATLLKVVIFVPALILSIIQAAINKKLGDYFYSLGIGTDIYGNKLIAPFANRYFKTNDGHEYGGNETISLCMAKNKKAGTSTKAGNNLGAMIEFFDKDHLNETLNKNNMNTIADFETMMLAKIAEMKAQYGSNTELNASQKATVSEQFDSVNETWNENLPPRPHN